MLGQLVGGFVTILVGVSLMPTVANEVSIARNVPFNVTHGTTTTATTVDGTAGTMLGLVPLFFALGVVSAGIAIAAQGLKAAGIM